jgi:hypothetical protein
MQMKPIEDVGEPDGAIYIVSYNTDRTEGRGPTKILGHFVDLQGAVEYVRDYGSNGEFAAGGVVRHDEEIWRPGTNQRRYLGCDIQTVPVYKYRAVNRYLAETEMLRAQIVAANTRIQELHELMNIPVRDGRWPDWACRLKTMLELMENFAVTAAKSKVNVGFMPHQSVPAGSCVVLMNSEDMERMRLGESMKAVDLNRLYWLGQLHTVQCAAERSAAPQMFENENLWTTLTLLLRAAPCFVGPGKLTAVGAPHRSNRTENGVPRPATWLPTRNTR